MRCIDAWKCFQNYVAQNHDKGKMVPEFDTGSKCNNNCSMLDDEQMKETVHLNGHTDPGEDQHISLPETEHQTAPSPPDGIRSRPPGANIDVILAPVCTKKMAVSVILALALALLVVIVLYAVEKNKNQSPSDVSLPHSCTPDWILYQSKCYYISEEERNWTSSQEFCTLHDASLASITDEDKKLISFLRPGAFWIGLRRSADQPWKWLNGGNATLKDSEDGGDCAFLDLELQAISFRSFSCSTTLHWICSKLNAPGKPN